VRNRIFNNQLIAAFPWRQNDVIDTNEYLFTKSIIFFRIYSATFTQIFFIRIRSFFLKNIKENLLFCFF